MKLADGTVIAVGWEQCYATCKREVFEASCDEREAGDDKIIVRLIEELSHAQSAKDASEQEARLQLGRRQEEIDALKVRVEELSRPVTATFTYDEIDELFYAWGSPQRYKTEDGEALYWAFAKKELPVADNPAELLLAAQQLIAARCERSGHE